MCGGGNGAAGEIERQNLAREQAIQQGQARINNVFSGYTPKFFENVRKSALASLLPQFNRQARTAEKGVAYRLANQGLLRSSSARAAGEDFALSKETGLASVVGQATDAMRNTQQQVESARSNATNALITSQDPTVAAQQAVSGASLIQAPSMVAPLGSMFKTFADTWYANNLGKTFGPTTDRSPTVSTPMGNNRVLR